jgi:hypothetical protein
MAALFEFVDLAGVPTQSRAQRTNNCIFVGPWTSGAQCAAVVLVANQGDAAAIVGVQFYLQNASGLNLIGGGVLGESGLNPGNSMAVALTYTPQGGDTGQDTLYAQIQSGPPPYPSPTDMTQPINASKTINVLVGSGHEHHGHPHKPEHGRHEK